MRAYFYALLIISVLRVPALGDVTISSPSNGDHVRSPFTLSASATNCSSQPVRTIGYSLDSSHNAILVRQTSISVQLSASPGTHTVHVKTWGNQGAVCVAQVSVTVSGGTADNAVAETSLAPAEAIRVDNIQALDSWTAKHDTASRGSTGGETSLVSSPSRSGSARMFVTSFSGGGDERYAVSFAHNRTSHNFLWDAWVYLASPSQHIANLEMDLNQTMSNGQTVIFGVQCDGYSGTWDYTENLGTPEQPHGNWARSSAACDPRKWSTDTWHHVQIRYSRDDSGQVTYHDVYLDDVESDLNVTVLSARALGWASALSTNFQVDGRGSGSSTVYLDELTVYRW